MYAQELVSQCIQARHSGYCLKRCIQAIDSGDAFEAFMANPFKATRSQRYEVMRLQGYNMAQNKKS